MKNKLEHKITTLESLYQHLQWAIEVEHFTIPPYLCALYSIKEGKNQEAARVIQSVVMEEMLHMTLVANIMNAVGVHPIIDKPGFIPDYPKHLPHSGDHFKVNLEKFSLDAIKTFMKIEKPQKKGAPVSADHYHTIGELYDAVEWGLKHLVKTLGPKAVFTGNRDHQVTNKYYYGGGGKIIEVHNLCTAHKAIAEIKEQGEGFVQDKNNPGSIFDGDEKYGQEPEVAHFYRFMEIKKGQKFSPGDTPKTGPTGPELPVDWEAVYPMQLNPKSIDYPKDSEIRQAMDDFNKTYTELLKMLHQAFNGKPDLLLKAVQIMYTLKYKAVSLMKIPSGDGLTHVGPSFEYFR
jgi:hypothetical protein